jgi:hypothetical protein
MSCNKTCHACWCWFSQFLLWFAIIFFIIEVINNSNSDNNPIAIFILILSYLNYIISNSLSPMCKYIFNRQKSDTIHNTMRSMYSSPPQLKFYVECFHYETKTSTSTDSNGNTKTSSTEEKVVTYRETQHFNFYTWRDISGLFLLDSHKIFRSKMKAYIKLELTLDVDFADDITGLDYQRAKDDLYNRNKFRDSHITIHEHKNVDGFYRYNMIKISDSEPLCINRFIFLIFLIIPLMEFYKIYINLFCVGQKYTIKKVISSRYDVNSGENSQRWAQDIPRLNIYNQPQVVFDQAPLPMHNNPLVPTLDDIEAAKDNSQLHESINVSGKKIDPLQENLL